MGKKGNETTFKNSTPDCNYKKEYIFPDENIGTKKRNCFGTEWRGGTWERCMWIFPITHPSSVASRDYNMGGKKRKKKKKLRKIF